jgi:hypothetical protein
MDPELKAKWVKALRSGEYKQARAALIDGDGMGGRSFCCLGVLCDVLGTQWDLEAAEGVYDGMQVRAPCGWYLSREMLEAVALDENTQRTLAKMNDNGGTFAIIAEHIERNL